MYDERARWESRARAEHDAERTRRAYAAVEMLDAFANVGAKAFDLTITSEIGEKVSFRRGVRGQELRRSLPDLLARCCAHRWNVIVRPKAPPVFLQLDDLDAERRGRLDRVSFLSLETSPGNFQAWVALNEVSSDDLPRRLRLGVGADPSASGATRVAGSRNFKPKYAPDYPEVAVCHVRPGNLTSEAELGAAGFLAPPDTRCAGPVPKRRPLRTRKRWPSYERCVADAPANHGGTAPDISRADFTFCLIAIDWGWTPDDTAARLMEESSKARENGERYARLTAQRAADALTRRRTAY
ncbi:MAG: hypothetical protein KGJ62_01650 [Armatimonadetes bacterium]|nr:hypothetical protein [Armatimonadota bacterium]MDE2205485.1 hypothetical protein [Armatimonadota bacterium]